MVRKVDEEENRTTCDLRQEDGLFVSEGGGFYVRRVSSVGQGDQVWDGSSEFAGVGTNRSRRQVVRRPWMVPLQPGQTTNPKDPHLWGPFQSHRIQVSVRVDGDDRPLGIVS